MRIECPKCHTKYEVEESYIPIGGGPIRCAKCGNIFGIYVEPMDIPMTEIFDEEPSAPSGPFAKPEFGETSFSPEYQKTEPANEVTANSDFNSLQNMGGFSSIGNETDIPFAPKLNDNMDAFGNIPMNNSQPDAQTNFGDQFEQAVDNSNDLGSGFSDFGMPPFAQPQAPIQKPAEQQSMPDFGVPPAFAQPASQPKQQEPVMPDFGMSPFAQPQAPTQKPAEQSMPDFGVPPAFAQPAPQPKQQEPVMPDFGMSPFAQPQAPIQKPAEQSMPDFGVPPAFAQSASQPKQQEPAMPDFGMSPFAQPQAPIQKPAEQSMPDFGVPPAFAQPASQPKQQEPVIPDFGMEPTIQPKVQKAEPPKAGGGMFDILLAGFNMPPNYNTMPENIQKMHKDAVKLARQLAKDILLYHKEEVERGLANGNIKESMKNEIEKSYKFYTQRIQPEIINSTNYFIEALNKIVAKGQKLF